MSERSGSTPGQSEMATYRMGPSESFTEGVVNAVAGVSDRNASPLHGETCLDSLYESIDTDALEALFERSTADSDPVTVAFSYSGYRVTVDDTGFISVTDE